MAEAQMRSNSEAITDPKCPSLILSAHGSFCVGCEAFETTDGCAAESTMPCRTLSRCKGRFLHPPIESRVERQPGIS